MVIFSVYVVGWISWITEKKIKHKALSSEHLKEPLTFLFLAYSEPFVSKLVLMFPCTLCIGRTIDFKFPNQLFVLKSIVDLNYIIMVRISSSYSIFRIRTLYGIQLIVYLAIGVQDFCSVWGRGLFLLKCFSMGGGGSSCRVFSFKASQIFMA